MPQPLLEGPPAAADESVRLRREIAGLEQELQDAKDEAATAKQAAADAVQAIRALRDQLDPLYKSMKMVFGEISRVNVGTAPQQERQSNEPSAAAPKWESWKRKLGGKQAEFIDALLEHGEMTGRQLMVATRCGQDTLYGTIKKLNQAQLLVKNSGRFSLKED